MKCFLCESKLKKDQVASYVKFTARNFIGLKTQYKKPLCISCTEIAASFKEGSDDGQAV